MREGSAKHGNAMTAPLVLGIDAGGTSFKLAIANGPQAIHATHRVPTTTPDETLAAITAWLEAARHDGLIPEAVGIASFGPVSRDPAAPDWGTILDTPKPGWTNMPLRERIAAATGLPCAFDTDVNGALLAEAAWGAAKGLTSSAYVTVGTGVGGAALHEGHLLGTPGHLEMGHVRLHREAAQLEVFPGTCSRHGDCVEGLASAPALEARWEAAPHSLPDDHPAWPVLARDLARLCAVITYMIQPHIILLGGGVMERSVLFDMIRARFEDETDGYGLNAAAHTPESFIVPPALGSQAGVLGGVILAQSLLKDTA